MAARMAKELTGKAVGGWKVDSLIGAGKSALVLRAEKERQLGALKVFDPDLVEHFGENVQLRRIERERSLIGKHHPNLVKILDGGKCNDTKYLFIVMELIEEKDLSEVLAAVPREKIRSLIAQLALAARYLEKQELAHRDIKPSNIAVSDDFEHLTLLDLGVLRPFGEVGLTDMKGQPFVGTLQYASPEYLFRKEEQTPEGFRALTFYQIGAVLHDLIKKSTIFEEYREPYARLVEAVKYNPPEFNVPGADSDLVALAVSCLVKDPALRLNLVSWDSFAATSPSPCVATIKDRVKKLQAAGSQTLEVEPASPALLRGINEVVGELTTIIRDECASNVECFPPIEVHDHPSTGPGVAMFRAAFPRSTGKNVPSAFAVLIQIKMLDVTTNIVEITASASTAGDVRKFLNGAFSAPIEVYRGPFCGDVVKTRIGYVLYAALAEVLSHPPMNQDECHPLNIVIPEKVD